MLLIHSIQPHLYHSKANIKVTSSTCKTDSVDIMYCLINGCTVWWHAIKSGFLLLNRTLHQINTNGFLQNTSIHSHKHRCDLHLRQTPRARYVTLGPGTHLSRMEQRAASLFSAVSRAPARGAADVRYVRERSSTAIEAARVASPRATCLGGGRAQRRRRFPLALRAAVRPIEHAFQTRVGR